MVSDSIITVPGTHYGLLPIYTDKGECYRVVEQVTGAGHYIEHQGLFESKFNGVVYVINEIRRRDRKQGVESGWTKIEDLKTGDWVIDNWNTNLWEVHKVSDDRVYLKDPFVTNNMPTTWQVLKNQASVKFLKVTEL